MALSHCCHPAPEGRTRREVAEGGGFGAEAAARPCPFGAQFALHSLGVQFHRKFAARVDAVGARAMYTAPPEAE